MMKPCVSWKYWDSKNLFILRKCPASPEGIPNSTFQILQEQCCQVNLLAEIALMMLATFLIVFVSVHVTVERTNGWRFIYGGFLQWGYPRMDGLQGKIL